MMSLPSLARVLTVCLTGFALASCKNTSNPMAISDPYATNAVGGGGYNPYSTAPGGTVANTPAAPTYAQAPTYQQPSYEAPPAPAPEPDPYSYEAPKTTPKKTTSSSTKKKTTTSSSSKRYTVKKGDGLYGIARKYGTTVTKLKSANGLTSDLIRIGQVLKIP